MYLIVASWTQVVNMGKQWKTLETCSEPMPTTIFMDRQGAQYFFVALCHLHHERKVAQEHVSRCILVPVCRIAATWTEEVLVGPNGRVKVPKVSTSLSCKGFFHFEHLAIRVKLRVPNELLLELVVRPSHHLSACAARQSIGLSHLLSLEGRNQDYPVRVAEPVDDLIVQVIHTVPNALE